MMEGQKESPEYSVYAVKNARRLMEDRHVVIPNLLSQFTDEGDHHYSYYAIFDGHAGPDAAQFAADNLHKNLVESSFFKSGSIRDAFRYAYATTDFQYTEKSSRDGIKAGCTAVTCLLENNRRLYMAWVGDSVALLSRNGKPYFFMEPHNLERDDEKERVEAMGGAVIYFDTWRVNGTLGVSRAIGDPEYKPYVCADPDIECIDLDGTEDFLVIGCDGLWDRMTPEDAIGLIYEHLQANSHLSVNELVNSTAQILSDKSINDGSGDNVTTIVLFLKDVSSILASFSSSSSSAATATATAASYNVGSASTLNGFHDNSVAGAGGVGGVESSSSFSSSSNNYTLDNNGYNGYNDDYGNNNTHNNSNGNIIDNEDTITATTATTATTASSTTTFTSCSTASSYNMNMNTNNNMNSYLNNNGLVHGMDNGMMRGEEEVIGSGGKSGGLDLKREEEEEDGRRRAEGGVGGGGDEKLVDREKEKEKEENENSGSTLNPFADAFEPNMSSASNSSKNNIIGSSGEFGNEPKKDYDVKEGDVESESTNRNERLDKKDLWMSEFKDDGNNDQHHQYQHDHKQEEEEEEKGKGKEKEEEEEEGVEKYSKQQKEMFDGSMDNGLSYSGKLTSDGDGDGVGLGNQESTGNLSSSEYSDNLSSEMIIHDDIEHENKFGDFEPKPSAPELVFIEGDQQQQQQQQQQDQPESQSSGMDDNLISQAETFVGNLTPNECPSSPIATNFDAHYEFTTTAQREGITTTSSNLISTSTINENFNQYITTVSDGMVSDPYHHDNELFGSDSAEPVSMIVNESNDVISSGPHAIDPYLLSSLQSSSSSSSVKEDKLESVSTKGDDGCLVGGVEVEGDALVNSSTGRINIADTQSIPLESLNPFDGGNDNNDNNVGIVNDELGVDISTGDETKGSFYEDNPDNSSGLLDFSDDQVNTIVITPNASGYQLDESSLMMMNSSSIGGTDVDLLSENGLKEQLSNVNKMSDQKEKEMKTCEAEEGKAEKLSSNDVKESKGSGKEEVEEQVVSTTIEATGSLINQINENENKDENENEKFDSKSSKVSSEGVDTSNAAAAVTAVGSSVIAAAGIAGVAVAVASKAKSTTTTTTSLVKKDAVSKTNVVKKSTLAATKNSTISRSTTATTTTASRATSSTTRKPLTSTTTTTSASSRLTSSVKSSSSLAPSKLSTSRQPTSTSTSASASTTSTSNVKNSTSTSRIGITSNLNKRPTQASATSTSSTTTASRVSSLASRTTTSTLAARKPGIGSSSSSSSPSSTTTSKPLSRTAGSTTTTTTRSTLGTSRLTTSTKPSTISSTSSSSSTARTGTGTGTTRTSGTISKRASTGTVLNRPSPSASSTLNTKSTSSALNRSLTNSSSSSSRFGASSTTTSTLSKSSTRPSTTSSRLASSSSTSSSSQLSKTSSRAPLAGRTSGTKSSTTTTAASKPTTSSNKVPVPRLGIRKTPSSSTGGSATTTTTTTTTSNTSDNNRNECSSSSPLLVGNAGSDDGSTTTTTTTTSGTTPGTIIMDNFNSEQGTNCSTPVDGTITNSIKRDKNLMPNSANSLKDELEAALASPISCEDKGVIKETKDDE